MTSEVSSRAEQAILLAGRSASELAPCDFKSFMAELEPLIRQADSRANTAIIFWGSKRLSALHWSLLLPYFTALDGLSGDHGLIKEWVGIACGLAASDVDTSVLFLTRSPEAVAIFGEERFLTWGSIGQKALSSAWNSRVFRDAARAYFKDSSAESSPFSLERWKFFLDQALRISEISASAAERFIRHGTRFCDSLSDTNCALWVDRGLHECTTEQDTIDFFSGNSSRAEVARHCLMKGVFLKDRKKLLAILCEALTGRPVSIKSNASLSENPYSWEAAADGTAVYLPDLLPEFSLYKVMALHMALVPESSPSGPCGNRHPKDPYAIHRATDARLLEKMPGLEKEMTRLAGEYQSGGDTKRLPWWGTILPDCKGSESDDALVKAMKAKAGLEYGEVSPELMEKLTLALISQGHKEKDALWANLSDLLGSIQLDSPGPENLGDDVKLFFYKEWDRTLQGYRPDWCQVRQRPASEKPNEFVPEIQTRLGGIIRLIRRQFMKLKPETFRKYKAQPLGDALDIDALIQAVVDTRSGAELSENVYIRREKRTRDVAVFFLMDLSGSTDEDVNGRRVIDIQKEAMAIMAEALDALGDPYAVYGFSSEGRFRVDLFSVKEFSEPYDDRAKHRLGNLEPLGLTRMGTVIRHAGFKLGEISAAVKLLVILTDGRPYDMEYGDLGYAIEDTRKAIQEAREEAVHPFIITSDQKGSDYLKRISPRTDSIILPNVELLPTLLPTLYRRLTL